MERKNLVQQTTRKQLLRILLMKNGIETHRFYYPRKKPQQLLGTQGAIIVDSGKSFFPFFNRWMNVHSLDGQPISIQQAPPQTFISPFALDQAQLQALLVSSWYRSEYTIKPSKQVDPNQTTTSSGLYVHHQVETQYTVLTQAPTQQTIYFTKQPNEPPPPPPPIQPQAIAPKEELAIATGPKRRAFAVKSTTRAEPFDDMNTNDRPRRKNLRNKNPLFSSMSFVIVFKILSFYRTILFF